MAPADGSTSLPSVRPTPATMPLPLNRRSFLHLTGSAAAMALLAPRLPAQPAPAGSPPKSAPARPPALPAEKIQEVVGQSHRSLDAVRQLVEEMPLLVNACWDWGGGDFETPLEAAAHTGQREIAEFLLARGARPSLFSAAMLGQLDLVQAFHAIDPQAHAVVGPHGFTLVHCARRGGERAQAVVDWLLAQGATPESNVGLKSTRFAGAAPRAT